jgi:serine/threonine-protein kinase
MKVTSSPHGSTLPYVLVSLGLALVLLSLGGGCGNADEDPADASIDAEVIDAGPPDADPPDALPLTIGLSTLAGGPEPGFQDGARNVASFDDPVNVAVAPDNVLFVADFNNGAIRRVTEDGQTTTFTHQPDFHRPFGIAFSTTGDLYVQTDRNSSNDTDGKGTGALWRVNSSTGAATLLVDNIGRVRGIDVLPDGRIVLSDYIRHVLKIYNPANGQVSVLAGAEDQAGFVDAKGANARFDSPYDIVVDPDVGCVYVSDFHNHRIRQVNIADGTVTTLSGKAIAGNTDGAIAAATYINPQGLAIDDARQLYVSDPGGHVIRKIDLQAKTVSTIAGDGDPGYVDNTDPLAARFYGLEGIDITNGGDHLYIADGDLGEGGPYHRIRRVAF